MDTIKHNRRKTDRWNWMEHLAKLLIAIALLITAIKQRQTEERVDRHKEEIKQNAVAIDAVGAAVGLPPMAAPPEDK